MTTCTISKTTSLRFVQKRYSGKGSFGNVTVCRDTHNRKRFVALKKLSSNDSDGIPYDFLRERTALRSADHENVLKLHEVSWSEDAALELEGFMFVLEGMQRSLAQEIRARRRIPKDLARRYLRQIEDGVLHLHGRGFMHRDMKPQNCLVNDRQMLKVSDLGTAIVHVPARCNTLESCTLWYRAPEVILGQKTYNYAVDVWGVGCIYMEMRVGRPPFTTCDVDEGTGWGLLVDIMKKRGTLRPSDWDQLVDYAPDCDKWPSFPARDWNEFFVDRQKEEKSVTTRDAGFDESEISKLDVLLHWDPRMRVLDNAMHSSKTESHERIVPSPTAMKSKTDINERMRYILVDWLFEVSHKFKLLRMTYHLAILAMDVFLRTEDIRRSSLQLLGVSAMLWASKLSETESPELRDFVYICDNAYKGEQIRCMELELDKRMHEGRVDFRGTARYVMEMRCGTSVTNALDYAMFLSTIDSRSYEFSPEAIVDACIHLQTALCDFTERSYPFPKGTAEDLLLQLHETLPKECCARRIFAVPSHLSVNRGAFLPHPIRAHVPLPCSTI